MKKFVFLTMLLLLTMILGLTACKPAPGGDETTDSGTVTTAPDAPDSDTAEPDETDPGETNPDETQPAETDPAETQPAETETQDFTPVDVPLPEDYATADDVYDCEDDSFVYSYKNKTADDYAAVCAFYKAQGYAVYSETDMGGSPAMTLTNKGGMAHVYWLKNLGELSIVTSSTAAGTLPPKTPAVTDGEVECTVGQLNNLGGMGYVIRLKDGSFIVSDGGDIGNTASLYNYLTKYNTREGKPVIRAWILTHSHCDHYGIFEGFAQNAKYSGGVIVENIIMAPLNKDVFTDLNANDEKGYLAYVFPKSVQRFKGAKVTFAHTGMEFTFCDLKMQFLCTPENLYKNTSDLGLSNNTSIVTRLYKDDYDVLLSADIMSKGCQFMMDAYGDLLKSDMVTAAHHGMDDAPLAYYDTVQAPVIFYACDAKAYDGDVLYPFHHVRLAVQAADYTKEILIAGGGEFIRPWGYKPAADAELSMPGYTPPSEPEYPDIDKPSDPSLKYELIVPPNFGGEKTSTVTIGKTSQGPQHVYIKFSKYGSICIGELDLSDVSSIVFDVTGQNKNWVNDYPDAHTIRICKDSAGTQIIAEADMVTTVGYGVEVFVQTIPLNTDYSGPVYIYLNCATGHEYAIANLKFPYKTGDETDPVEPDTPEPETDPVEPEPAEPALSDGILSEDELLALTDKGANTIIGKTFSNFPEVAFIKFEPTSGGGWVNLGFVDLSKFGSLTYEVVGSTLDWHSRTDIDNGEHYITFCSDAEGNNVLFKVHMGNVKSGEFTEMTADLAGIDYAGNLYMHIETKIGGRYYGITNVQFHEAENDGTDTDEPETDPVEPDTNEPETDPVEPALSDGVLTDDEIRGLTEMGSNTAVDKVFSNFPETAFVKFEPTSGGGWVNLGFVDLSKFGSLTYEVVGSTLDWHSRTDIDNGEHYITFCSDAEGNNVLFKVHMGNVKSDEFTEMTADLAGIDYAGNLYMHIETKIGGRYYGITNMQFHEAEEDDSVLSDGALTEDEIRGLTEMGANTAVDKVFSNFPEVAFIKFEPTNGNGWINLGYVDLSKYTSMTYEATGSTIDWHSRTDINNGEHYFTFCSDAEGNNVLFRVHLGNINSGVLTEMTADLAGINYVGNLYMHIETQIGGRYYGITNMQFHTA